MIGKTILHYKILEKLGEGGMGVVYKAEDTKLKREVALKFLPTNVLQGPDEKARFTREAQAAAALNHANIAHIYAIEEHEGQMFIAMEYINGQSLEGIVGPNGRSPLRLNDAIDYATQIAAGLQAAHEKGVIHRDIKSANLMVTDKGVVKIMDFGLAKLANRSKMTVEGSTLGTAAYMSPEQARGQALDKRSDIWSLGVVLYEMIAGQCPFKGDYEQAVIYSILNEEPEPLTALRSGLPIALDGIIAKALAKDPAVRYQHVDEIPADLKAISLAGTTVSRLSGAGAAPTTSSGQPARKSGRLPWIIAGASLLALGLALMMLLRPRAGAVTGALRVNLSALTSKSQSLLRTDIQAIALSPDGNTLVYSLSENGQSLLYRRTFTDFAAQPITGSVNGRSPFFSPDGQWIGFLADGKIKKVAISGGVVETVCEAPGFRGASWGMDDRIVFSPGFATGLMTIAAAGGEIRPLSSLDSTQMERTHRWPQVLPDGKWVLYTAGDQSNPNSYVNARLAMQSLETGERHLLNVRGEMARYLEPGYLIIARNGTLLAAPFDLKQFKTTRPPTPVLLNVDGDEGSGISYFAVSQSGRLAYIPGIRNREMELVMVDMQGKAEPLPVQHGAYFAPRFSPDGGRLAVTLADEGDKSYDIWRYDFKSSVFNRATFSKRMQNPVWSPDGKKLYFSSDGGAMKGILTKPADGSSTETSVFSSDAPLLPVSIAPGGKELILNRLSGPSEGSMLVLDLSQKQAPRRMSNSGNYEYGGSFSADGRFLVYGSNETGTLEVFVKSFPDMKGKWQISNAGGYNPIWSPDGGAIYYISPLARMMVVSISTTPSFLPGKPREVFDVSQMFFPNSPIPNYDISPDGKHLVMVRNTRENANAQVFNVILNWTDELAGSFNQDD